MINIDSLEAQVITARKNMSSEDQLSLNEYINIHSKSVAAAWILWVFFGRFGAHRFYLKRNHALLMLILWIIGWLTAIIFIGIIILSVIWIWCIVDAFSIQEWIKEDRIQKAYDGIPIITGKSVLELTGKQSSSFDVNFDDQTDFSKPRE